MSKKGFTLVEVIVALGILAMVFAGTVTLIVRISALGLSARDKTTGVALAQGKLESVIANFQSNCPTETIRNETNIMFPENPRFSYSVSNNTNISYTSTNGNYSSASPNFTELTVRVSWKGPFGDDSYTIKRIIKKCEQV